MDYQKCNFNHNFTKRLKSLPDCPQELWCRGKLPDDSKNKKVVSIVGARRCTDYGKRVAYDLAYELARLGVIIVSGMAYGIDSQAHKGCLDAGGITVAILGTPIDEVYPSSNLSLSQRILEKGALISEYEPRAKVERWHFLHRNRIVSGLSDAVVIVEAAARSGTLYTANIANEQGKDVFVVPGDIHRPTSAGCNELIKNGCMVFTGIDDVLMALKITKKQKNNSVYCDCSEGEQRIIASIKKGKQSCIDIIAETKYSVSELTQLLMSLEMKGIIYSVSNDRWALAQ